jgi:hypothetical protein
MTQANGDTIPAARRVDNLTKIESWKLPRTQILGGFSGHSGDKAVRIWSTGNSK